MFNNYFDHLLATAIRNGGLQQDQIAQILNFKLFGNKQGFLLLKNLSIGDIPPTPLSREEMQRTFAICNPRFYTERLGRQSRVFELVIEI